MIVQNLVEQKQSTTKALRIVRLPKSTYYYKKRTSKQGRKPSSFTQTKDGIVYSNETIVDEIKRLLENDFIVYGYEKITHYLRQKGYLINKKKVYRLMKENNLLLKQRIRPVFKREFITSRKVKSVAPFTYLEMDIKYIYIQGEKRNVYLLTLIDIYSRMVLNYILAKSITKNNVIQLYQEIEDVLLKVEKVIVRNDNGSQFIANDLREYLKNKNIHQEFTHVSSPKENAHIEAYHSILEREVISRFEFETYEEAFDKISKYNSFYNCQRIHSSINFKSPKEYINEALTKSYGENIDDLYIRISKKSNIKLNIKCKFVDTNIAQQKIEQCWGATRALLDE